MRLPLISIAVVAIAVTVAAPAFADKKQVNADATEILAIKEISRGHINASTNNKEENEIQIDEVIEEELVKYESPYDFELLREENKDIIAWIDIPGTMVDYPVLYDGTDRYLNMNLGGEKSVAGSIYVDATAEAALEESVNIIYGHHMKNGSMFASIDDFSNDAFWSSHKEINIYKENEELHLKPALCVVGKSDITLREINDLDALKDFCNNKEITQGSIPSEMEELYVFVTCNYSGENYRTYLFCTK